MASLPLVAFAAGFGGSYFVERYQRSRTRCRATSTSVELDIKKKTSVEEQMGESVKPSRDMWVVLIHAPMGSCNMPWCAIPGLSPVICHCKRDGVTPPAGGGGKALRSRDGKCALSMIEYAELIAEGVPVLPRAQAHRVASSLFESAMHNPVGSAVVVSTFRRAAEEYRERLADLGCWVSVVPIDRD